ARHAVAAIHGALGGVAPGSFQEELRALAAAQSANRSNMTSHGESTALDRVNRESWRRQSAVRQTGIRSCPPRSAADRSFHPFGGDRASRRPVRLGSESVV